MKRSPSSLCVRLLLAPFLGLIPTLFVPGPQGQSRLDLPRGEVLLAGALDALPKSVAFVKASPR